MGYYPESLDSRDNSATIAEQSQRIAAIPAISDLMNNVPSLMVIVNQHRQIVFANEQVVRKLNLPDYGAILGRRPGEALGCEHAAKGYHGCGTDKHCEVCGTARAIRQAEMGEHGIYECRLHQEHADQSLDLRVSSAPMVVGGQQFSVVSMTDISDENRRRSLERIFFHDVLNTLGALTGYVELLREAPTEQSPELTETILLITGTLSDEILGQRDLVSAENNELVIHNQPINSREVLGNLELTYRKHPVAESRTIRISADAESLMLETDRRLLSRILANMLKNAMEASPVGGQVTMDCRRDSNAVRFSVANTTFMSPEIQMQVFHRAFSTKGAGRGLGTYSMKLLGEKYLGGDVGFTSTPQTGTIFFISLPS